MRKREQQKQKEELEDKIEESIQASFERMQHEILRLNASRLRKIKNPKERETERAALLANADVLEEYDIE